MLTHFLGKLGGLIHVIREVLLYHTMWQIVYVTWGYLCVVQWNLSWKTTPLAIKIWSLKTGGLWWQVHIHWNVGLSAKNWWSFKTCGLSWQWSLKTGFTVLPYSIMSVKIAQMLWAWWVKDCYWFISNYALSLEDCHSTMKWSMPIFVNLPDQTTIKLYPMVEWFTQWHIDVGVLRGHPSCQLKKHSMGAWSTKPSHSSHIYIIASKGPASVVII